MPNDRRKILRAIAREGRHIKGSHARQVYLKAAVETGIVESNLSNPSGGDADSAGWRQERASLYADPTNIRAAARRFRQEFQQHYDPGEKSYDVAAQVQRPAAQYRGRYKDVAGQAKQVIASELGGVKGGQPNTRQGSSVTSYKTTPGVDNSALRQQARLSYLDTPGDPHDKLLTLASSLSSAQDTPSTRVKVKGRKTSSAPASSSGGHSSLHGIASSIDDLASRYGAPITAGQEPGHATGGDHDPAVKGATARDIGGSEAQRERIFKKLTKQLGVKGVYKGADINVVKGGVRYQIISRDHGTGPHLHVGIRKAK